MRSLRGAVGIIKDAMRVAPMAAIAGKPLRRVSRSSSLSFPNLLRRRDLAAMSVAQRLAVETAPLDVQAYSGDWRTLEEAITRSSKTLLTGMASKCAAHSPLLPLINLALG